MPRVRGRSLRCSRGTGRNMRKNKLKSSSNASVMNSKLESLEQDFQKVDTKVNDWEGERDILKGDLSIWARKMSDWECVLSGLKPEKPMKQQSVLPDQSEETVLLGKKKMKAVLGVKDKIINVFRFLFIAPSINPNDHNYKYPLFTPASCFGFLLLLLILLVYPIMQTSSFTRIKPTKEISHFERFRISNELMYHPSACAGNYFQISTEFSSSFVGPQSFERSLTKSFQGTVDSLLIKKRSEREIFQITFDVGKFSTKDVVIKTSGNKIDVLASCGNRLTKVYQEYKSEVFLPMTLNPCKMKARLDEDGFLYITAPLSLIRSPFNPMVTLQK